MMCIYKIENLVNGKFYIGSAKNFSQRKSKHLFKLRRNKHHSPILQNAWNKYGEESFNFSILAEISDIDFLIPSEQHYMDTLFPYYNCVKVAGLGNRTGISHSETSKQRMSSSQKERLKTIKHPLLGFKMPESSKKTIADKLVKGVIQYDLLGNKIKEWRSAIDAEKELGITRVNINQCCRGKIKTSGKFIWSFKE
jgi:group I intron endonuclease